MMGAMLVRHEPTGASAVRHELAADLQGRGVAPQHVHDATLVTSELLGNARPLYEEVAADLWRAYAADAGTVDALTGLWNGPDALAADLPALCGPLTLLPPAPADDDGEGERRIAVEATRAGRAAHLVEAYGLYGAEARAAIAAAFDGKVFDGRRAKRPSFDKAFAELEAGMAPAQWPRTDKTHVQKLLPETLVGFCKDGEAARVPESPLFDALRAWCGWSWVAPSPAAAPGVLQRTGSSSARGQAQSAAQRAAPRQRCEGVRDGSPKGARRAAARCAARQPARR